MSATPGFEAEPSNVENLFANLCGDLMEVQDWLVRYTQLTAEQALYYALALRIKQARGEALAEGVTAAQREAAEGGQPIGVVEARRIVGDATGLGTHQRVEQLTRTAVTGK